ncbi:Protein of unknown function [Bacillus cytotoxicus]|jgi:hypothetical protein
MVTL